MSTLRILDQWDMVIPDESHEKWFLDWVRRSPKQAGGHLYAGWLNFITLRNVVTQNGIDSVYEAFGGIGAQSMILHDLFDPTTHIVGENSPEAVAHLQQVLPGSVDVWEMDAYRDELWGKVDLVSLDFGDFTARWVLEGESKRRLLDHAFLKMKPKAVVLTDIASRYLHLQKGGYEKILGEGTCDTYPQYLEALSKVLEEISGYLLLCGWYERWSTVMTFVRPDVIKGKPYAGGMLLPLPKSDKPHVELL